MHYIDSLFIVQNSDLDSKQLNKLTTVIQVRKEPCHPILDPVQQRKPADTHDHLFAWCHLLKKDRLLRAVVVMNMQVSCNKAINMLG